MEVGKRDAAVPAVRVEGEPGEGNAKRRQDIEPKCARHSRQMQNVACTHACFLGRHGLHMCTRKALLLDTSASSCAPSPRANPDPKSAATPLEEGLQHSNLELNKVDTSWQHTNA